MYGTVQITIFFSKETIKLQIMHYYLFAVVSPLYCHKIGYKLSFVLNVKQTERQYKCVLVLN